MEVICAGKPVFFRDCNTNQDPSAVIFYSPGPGAFDPQNYSQDDLLEGEESVTLAQPGTYSITQVINIAGAGGTKVFEKTYEVRGVPEPSFTFQSCASGAVSFTVTDTNYDTYTFDFGDGATAAVAAGGTVRHTYTSPGTYSVTLSGSYNTAGSCGNTSTQRVSALPLLDQDNPTQLEKLTVLEQGANGSIQLEVSGLVPGYSYIVEQYTDDFRDPFKEISLIEGFNSSTLTHTVNDVNTSEGTWYLVRPLDACGVVFINSNIVSAISLGLTTNEEQVTLRWENLPEFAQYEVYRNGTLLETLPASTLSYVDNEVTCGQTYSYYIVGTGTDPEGDSYSSVSATVQTEVTSTAVPDQPYLLSSFNLSNQVELTLQTNESGGLVTLERSINGAPYKQLARVPQVTYTDAAASPQPVCYRATFTNSCGNTSAVSNVSCPVILQAEQQTDGSVQLGWTPYTGFPGGVQQYTVELLNADGTVALSYPATGTSFTDRTLSDELQVLRYRVRATSPAGTEVSYSNLEEIEQDALLYIPSAFTPNGDGLNDTFEVKGKFFSSYLLRIYNRLGNVIYEGTEADPAWDGTENGQKVLTGAYAYEITVQTSFGTTKQRRGTVTLLR